MMLEEDLKSFEAMVGFILFCIVVMFGEVFDIIPDPYGYIKYVIWILSIIITWHAGCTNRVMRINRQTELRLYMVLPLLSAMAIISMELIMKL